MTSVLYFLHLKTLDILLLIVNISVADDAFYKKIYIVVIWRLNLTWKTVNFQLFFVVVKMTKRWSTDLLHSVICLLYNSK